MEELSAGAESGWSCPMVKNGVVTVVRRHPGVGVLEMIIAEEVLLLAADHREGEAFLVAAADPSQETEEERDHFHGREITSLPVPFPGLVVALGRMKGNRTSGGAVYRKSLDLSTGGRSVYRTLCFV